MVEEKSRVPEWAQPGKTVAIKSRSGWYTGTVDRITKTRIYVNAGRYSMIFYQPTHSAGWHEYGTSLWNAATLYDPEAPVAKAGLALARRAAAALAMKTEVNEALTGAASKLTVEDAERAITALSHFITYVKATEANSETSGEA